MSVGVTNIHQEATPTFDELLKLAQKMPTRPSGLIDVLIITRAVRCKYFATGIQDLPTPLHAIPTEVYDDPDAAWDAAKEAKRQGRNVAIVVEGIEPQVMW